VHQRWERIAQAPVAVIDAHRSRKRGAALPVHDGFLPCDLRLRTGGARGRQAHFVSIGGERDVDSAQRRDLFLPIGAPDRWLDDDEALVGRVVFEFDAAQTAITGKAR